MNYRRIPSHHNPEQSFLNPNESSIVNSTRTISSSSTSMMSTPSNNIRKLNQDHNTNGQNQIHQQGTQYLHHVNPNNNHHRQDKLKPTSNNIIKKNKPKKSTNVNLVKNKLLNLQKSLKIYGRKGHSIEEDEEEEEEDDDGRVYDDNRKNYPNSNTKGFILRRPLNMNLYDYSVFTGYADEESNYGDHFPPAIRESQIKAWESAEKISSNLIFDNDSDLSDDEYINEGETHEEVEQFKPTELPPPQLQKDQPQQHNQNCLLESINSIPGYTKEELSLITKRFTNQQMSIYESQFNLKNFEDEERKLLWKFRQNQQLNQEKIFSQYQSLTGKRKIQVSQKKDLLNKMFGYNNVLNQEYITNNTSYSSLDNIMNTQKSFHEDKEEITQLLDEDKEYHISIEETKLQLQALHSSLLHESFRKKYNKNLDDFDYGKFQSLIAHRLNKIYEDADINKNDHRGTTIGINNTTNSHNALASSTTDDESNEELMSFSLAFLRKCNRIETPDDNLRNV